MMKILVFIFMALSCQGDGRATDEKMVAIVNSMDIKDLKASIPPEDRSVSYVYARSGSPEEALTIPTQIFTGKTGLQREKYCIVQVDENGKVRYYEGTVKSLRDQGKEVIDLLCEGDLSPEGDKVLNKGALVGLVG